MLRGIKFFALVFAVVALFALARGDLQNIRTLANSTNFIVTQMAEVTRIEKEMLQFRVNAAAIAFGNPAVSRDQYLLSFDVLWARVNTDRSLFVHTPVEPLLSFNSDIAGLSAAMKEIDPIVQSLRRGDLPGLARIEAAIGKFAPAMTAMNAEAYRAMYNSSINAALAQRAVVKGLDHVQWVFLIAGFSVLVVLLAQLRRGERLYAELQAREAELRTLASVDPLTGLSNRRQFDERMQAIDAGERSADLHLLLIDLDGFKKINDQRGHAAGDHLLRVIARRLPAVTGRDALIARLGGDEFAVVLTAKAADARRTAQAIVREISAPIVYENVILKVGATIGMAAMKPVALASGRLLREADAALYQAKSLGRGRVHLYCEPQVPVQSAA